jgi:hypothetical protein
VLIAAGAGKGGRRVLVVGLEQRNVERLLNDEPIEKALDDVPGLEGWTLYVLGPEDFARFVGHVDAGDIKVERQHRP